MAEDAWSYATGERSAERECYELERADTKFEQAAAPVVVVRKLNAIEHCQEQERQHQKMLELERQPQKAHRGPALS